MLQYFLQIYFIFLLCIIIEVNYGISQVHAAGEVVPLSGIVPKGKCTMEYCTCAQIPRWKGVDCSYLLGYGFPTLTFRSLKYLPGKMFLGLNINTVILLDRDVDVADNVLEGIIYIIEFKVEASKIKVIYFLLLKNFIFSSKVT